MHIIIWILIGDILDSWDNAFMAEQAIRHHSNQWWRRFDDTILSHPATISQREFEKSIEYARQLFSGLLALTMGLWAHNWKYWKIMIRSRHGLTHGGRVTHICVSKQTIIGSDNGSSPGRRQAIIWTDAGILLIGPLGTNFNEILIEIHTFSFKKMHLKMSSAKWRPFCLGLNVLIHITTAQVSSYVQQYDLIESLE